MEDFSKSTRPRANLLLVPPILLGLALQFWLSSTVLVAAALTFEGAAARDADYDEAALQLYERAHRWNPHDESTLFALGNLRRQFGLKEEAAEALSRGLLLAPNDALSLTAYADLLFDLGRIDQAESKVQRAQSLAPASWKAEDVAGLIRGVQGDHASAAAHFERALTLLGRPDPDIFSHLAKAYFQQGELENALQFAKMAVNHRKLSPNYRLIQGKILLALNRPEEAAKDLAWAERVYLRRADEIDNAQQKLDDTRRYYVRAEAARKWPGRAVAILYNLAVSEGATEEVKDLAADLRQRLDTLGGHLNTQAQYDLGRVLFIAEDYEAADSALMRALRALPDEQRIACTLLRSQALIRIGKADHAVELLASLSDSGQQSAEFRIALGDALAASGKPLSARLEYEVALAHTDLPQDSRRELEAKRDALKPH